MISTQAEVKYWKAKAIGNKDLEYEALLEIIYSDILNPILKDETRVERYKELKESYEENFKLLGVDFPKYPGKDVV